METVENFQNESLQKKKVKSHKLRTIIIIGICLVLLSVSLYFIMFRNTIKNIKITNNNILSDEYILDLTDISLDSRYLFFSTLLKQNKASKSPFIDEISIEIGKYNSVTINVKENLIVGYIVEDDENSFFVLADGSLQPFDAFVIKNLALLPIFVDVPQELISKIAVMLARIDLDVLFRISEVSTTSFTYEANMIRLTMDDGYYIYSSIPGLPYITDFNEIVCNNKNLTSRCILIIEEYSSAAVLDCSEIEKYQVKKDVVEQ